MTDSLIIECSSRSLVVSWHQYDPRSGSGLVCLGEERGSLGQTSYTVYASMQCPVRGARVWLCVCVWGKVDRKGKFPMLRWCWGG